VCEVLSDSTRRHDLTVKVPMYFRHGVGHAWLIDADAQTLQVYRRVTDGWLLVLAASGDDAVRAEPFDAIELDLAALWRW
jgi:Uma2 family endonuclease